MMKRNWITFFSIFLSCYGMMLTACSSDEDNNEQSTVRAEALVGEWIVEMQADDIGLNDADAELDFSDGDYTVALIYHFYDDGSCWKEIDVMQAGRLVDQPVDRYSTDGCKYSVEGNGKVVVDFADSEESEELLFDGNRLSVKYEEAQLTLSRATEQQTTLYQDVSDAWHGGSADIKYNVADFKPKDVDNSQWMKQLKDSRLVADLSLPGSHDACTAEGWNNPYIDFIHEMIAKCQDLTIQEQLKVGVRVFDLRPEHDLDGSKYVLRCCHGLAGTKMYVSDFFKTLKEWLAVNPTEFCIVTVELTATKDKTAWGKAYSELVNSAEFKSMFADFKARLTVGELRGKVLMLSKWEYGAKPLGGYCYGWSEDLELEKQQQGHITAADGSETPLWVQDYWKDITRANKDLALLRMLEAAVTRDMTAAAPAWVINYPSAYIGGAFSDNYRLNAVSANKLAIDWLDSHKGSVGIIYMDFAGMDKSPDYTKTKLYDTAGMKLVDRIIKQNLK